jgi:uncharacterized protein (DUF2236 family)
VIDQLAGPESSKMVAADAVFPAFLTRSVKLGIARQVAGLFNDQARSERPVARRSDGLFGPQSVAWRVHGDVTSMLVGGIAALLLQMRNCPG